MDRWEFEKICTESRLRPVFRHNTPNAVILIADGWFASHPDRPYPHHRTVWAIGNQEDELKIGRDLYHEGEPNSTTLDERIGAACEDALTHVVGLTEAQHMIREHRNPKALFDA